MPLCSAPGSKPCRRTFDWARTVWLATSTAMVLVPIWPAQCQEPATGAQALASAAIEQAIKDLGHEEFAVRERATEYLIGAGETAIPAVQAAAKSTDPEVALRAKIVLKRVASGVPPGMPPELASLIEDFISGNETRKRNLISKLERPAEFQVLTGVVAKEKNAAQRQVLESMLRSRVASLASQHYRTSRHRRRGDAIAVARRGRRGRVDAAFAPIGDRPTEGAGRAVDSGAGRQRPIRPRSAGWH